MKKLILLLTIHTALAGFSAHALEWDTIPGNGTADGGTGVWDLVTPSWFNGSTNVPWDSTSAVFGGPANHTVTISVPSGGIQASAITSNSRIFIRDDVADGDLTDDALIPQGMMLVSGPRLAYFDTPIIGAGGLDLRANQVWLTKANSFAGGTQIRTLVNALTPTAFGTGDVVLHSGSFSFSSAGTGVISNNFTIAGGSYMQFAGGQTLTGKLNLQASIALAVFGPDLRLGEITGSPGAQLSLSINNFGSVRLLANSNFSGRLLVENGSLIANSGNGLPNATIALQGSETNGHATLAGTGIFGPVDLAGGPINISPGDGGIGALAIGTLDDTSITGTGAKFNFELGSTSDQLIVNGSIDIGFSSRLNLQTVAGFAPTEGDILFLINNDGVDAFGGRFSAYPEGLEFSLGGSLLKSTYAADASANSFTAGNDFAVKVIPEPSAVGMLALAATALLARRKRPAARQLALPIPHTRIASN